MKYIEIEGGHPIRGELAVQGSKNAALPMMAAALLTSQPVVLEGCPEIEDVRNMCQLLRYVGADVEEQKGRIRICAKQIRNTQLPTELVSRMRSSILLLGPLLSRIGKAGMCFPGGCVIGSRPIDLHIEGLRKLGYAIQEEENCVWGWKRKCSFECDNSLDDGSSCERIRQIHLKYPSVGATENLLMASVLKPGETILTGVAREPEVRELARMLQQMGAHLEGAGSEQIRIRGAVQLKGICRRVITDRIVTGTYLIAAAVTRGEVLLQDVSPMENRAILQILEDMGCQINGDEKQRWIHLRAPEYLKAVSAVTGPYPEFPTDLQAMLVTAMSQAEGISHIEETVFENRFRYVEALRRMGAKVSVKENRATVWGRCSLVGSELWATDLRAGAAMVLAGLASQGKSRIYHLNYVERGYESIASDLFALGAQIRECVE